MRSGRIDRKFQYTLATKQQAAALFRGVYRGKHTNLLSEMALTTAHPSKYSEKIPSAPLTLSEKESTISRTDSPLTFQNMNSPPRNSKLFADIQAGIGEGGSRRRRMGEQVREERQSRNKRKEKRRLKKMR